MRRLAAALALAVCTIAEASRAEPEADSEATPAAPAITLEEAVRQAIAHNPTAEVAMQEILRSEALAKQVRAAWLPTLTGNGVYTRLDADRELSGRVILSANQLHGDLTLAVPIIAANRWAAYSHSKEGINVARASQADARRDVAVAAARAYLTVIAQRRVLNSAERALKTAKAHEEYSSTRFKGGVGNRLDSVRASQERASAVVRVKQQVAALQRAREALGVIVAGDGLLDAVVDPPSLSPATAQVPPLDVAVHEAPRRADIEAQRRRVELARKTARDSWLDYMPVLSAVAQPFYQSPATFSTPVTGWQAQLLLSIPLFDGGLRYGVADERRVLEAEARTKLEGALRQARSEVRVAFESMRQADEALVGAREAADLAHESLELAQLAYQAGATSNIEVIDAERRAHEADTDNAIAEDASRQARLDLLAACGRFP
jgi:outer membrane protein TolC